MTPKEIDIDFAITTIEHTIKDFQVPVVDLIQAQTQEPWKVLVATILSARTKDEVTAAAVRRLFLKAKSLDDIATLSYDQLEKIIHPVGFYKNKAKYLKALPGAVNELFHGVIPDIVEELVKLPGVGRKTANLVVAVAYQKPAICVDTHVHRIMNIWNYVQTSNPLETEMALRRKLPQKYWLIVNKTLVAFGQSICRSVSPHCSQCPLNSICPKNNVTPRRNSNNIIIAENMRDKGLKLISWNVNGVRAIAQKNFAEIIANENPDILAIQETKAQEGQLNKTITDIENYQSFWHSAIKKGYSGVAVYSKIPPINVIYGLDIEEFDNEGRVITLEFDNFFLVNCYYPNAQNELLRLDYKQRFNLAILNFCKNLRDKKSVVICGDYNVAHKAIDLKNPKQNENNAGYSLAERNDMDNFISNGFVDTFRMFNQLPDQYSWWSYRFNAREKNIGWRIDYFCVDEKSRNRVLDADIRQDIKGSDHCPITLWFSPKIIN